MPVARPLHGLDGKLSACFDTALINISSGSDEDDYCGVEGMPEFWF